MSNARSPREVCSTTIGTSGLIVLASFAFCGGFLPNVATSLCGLRASHEWPRRPRRLPSMPDLPTTCVIGAGVSGLTALKALRDWRVPHTCFDASADLGGNRYYRNPNGRTSPYRSL